MKPERIIGTYLNTYRKLLLVEYALRRCTHFYRGHLHTGTKTLHRTPSARRIAKLNRLSNG
jgi:hypothetical protein